MDTQIKKLTNTDISLFEEILCLFKDTFKMEPFVIPDNKHLQQILQRPNLVVWAALEKQEVVGGLTAHILPSYYRVSAELYIYDLAIKPTYQRKGFGSALMKAVEKYCITNGIELFYVQAAQQDTHAINFYNTMNGEESKVRHFSFPIK